MAPSPPRATVFRLAAPGSVPVGLGGRVPVVWVPFPDMVVAGASVVEADVVASVIGALVVSVDWASVVEAAEEEGADVEGALVWGAPVGTLRVTPAPAQRPEAASTVSWYWVALHAPITQGTRFSMKEVARQMQAKSVV